MIDFSVHNTSDQSIRPISRRGLLIGASGLLAGGLLTGCGIVPEVNTPLNLYSVSPKVADVTNPPSLDWQLVVAEPKAGADLATNRIALSRAANRIEYFAEGVWSDAAPALVQSKLIEAFEDVVPQLAVGRDSAGLKPDYILQSELRDFQAAYSGSSGEAVVRITAKLVKMPERKIVKSIAAEARQPSAGGGLPGIVAAFEAALGDVFNQLIAGVLAAPQS
ncbi:ABC-type transport auxiliary lipoprotein family protein [Dongia sp.]|uniref:ABC-type transport auxiliary lipoprotein family protein n=1 Tax=Dongia sp. TaxID=1977262 RepID=UPI0035B25EE0